MTRTIRIPNNPYQPENSSRALQPKWKVQGRHLKSSCCQQKREDIARERECGKTSKATERLASSTLAILYAGLPGICPGPIADTTRDQRSESAPTVNLLLCYKTHLTFDADNN
jgi:hypothetical protein